MTGLYLLHFDPPLKHAKHYLGWAKSIDDRVSKHRDGTSRCKLTGAAAAAGINMIIARMWPGANRYDEVRLKKQGGLSRLCPICRAAGPTRDQVYAAKKKSGTHEGAPDAVKTLLTAPGLPTHDSSSSGVTQNQT